MFEQCLKVLTFIGDIAALAISVHAISGHFRRHFRRFRRTGGGAFGTVGHLLKMQLQFDAGVVIQITQLESHPLTIHPRCSTFGKKQFSLKMLQTIAFAEWMLRRLKLHVEVSIGQRHQTVFAEEIDGRTNRQFLFRQCGSELNFLSAADDFQGNFGPRFVHANQGGELVEVDEQLVAELVQNVTFDNAGLSSGAAFLHRANRQPDTVGQFGHLASAFLGGACHDAQKCLHLHLLLRHRGELKVRGRGCRPHSGYTLRRNRSGSWGCRGRRRWWLSIGLLSRGGQCDQQTGDHRKRGLANGRCAKGFKHGSGGKTLNN